MTVLPKGLSSIWTIRIIRPTAGETAVGEGDRLDPETNGQEDLVDLA